MGGWRTVFLSRLFFLLLQHAGILWDRHYAKVRWKACPCFKEIYWNTYCFKERLITQVAEHYLLQHLASCIFPKDNLTYKSLFSAQVACIHKHQICWILNIVDLLHGVSGMSSESEVSSRTLGVYAWSAVCPEHIWLVHCRTWHWSRTSWSAYVQVLLPKISWVWKFPLAVGRFLFPLGHNFHVEKEDVTRGTPGVQYPLFSKSWTGAEMLAL